MKKNVSGQTVGAQLISKTDGSAVTTGATDVYITGDAGTQTIASGSPTGAVHEGNGYWSFMPSQAETNYDHVAFTFVNSSAVNVTVQIYTSFPQTGDNFARLGAPAGASVSADVAAVKAVLPAALVSGRIDASVGAMAANTLTATAIASDAITAAKIADGAIDAATFAAGAINAAAIASDAITDAKVASDVTIASVTGAVGSVTGNVGGNVSGSVGSVATGGIAASSFAAGAIDASAIASNAITAAKIANDAITAAKIATDAIDADAIAADAVTEIQSGLSTLNAAGVRSAVGLASANLDTQLGALATASALTTVGSNVTAVKTVTDLLQTMIETGSGSPTYYRYKAGAIELAPTGGTAPTAAQIADEVQTRTIAAVTTVNGLAANTVTASALAADAVTEIQSGLSTLTAAGVRTAVGLASANLDTQLDALPTAAENADKLLGRSLATGADGGRTVQDALRSLRNKSAIAAGTLTVYQEDDSTSAWTAAVTTTAGDPLSAIDPA